MPNLLVNKEQEDDVMENYGLMSILTEKAKEKNKIQLKFRHEVLCSYASRM